MKQATTDAALYAEVFPDEASQRLYQKALADQWQVENVDWQTLDFAQLAKPVRRAMGAIYRDVHLAESVGLRAQGRIVDLAPAGWLRQFSAVQVMDEARHVDFFARLVGQLDAPCEASAAMHDWCREMLSLRDHDALMLSSLILETTAQVLFVEGAKHNQELRRTALRMPGTEAVGHLLDYVLHYVGRDESRHVAFGVRYLETRFVSMPSDRRRAFERQVGAWCELLYASYESRRPQYARLGFSADALLDRLWRAQRRQLAHLGLELGDRPMASPGPREAHHGG